MLAQYVGEQATPYPIRPFSMASDLAQLAELIEVAFGSELRATGSHMAEDMRQMAQWGPVLYLVQGMTALLAGYVWVEDGQLIGNASITSDDKPGVWILSNVAVLPAYRGRGIAGHLVDIAIDHVRQRHGARLLLEVRSDNAPAIMLYTRRGFARYDTIHEMALSSGRWPVVVGQASDRLRPPRRADSADLFRLVLANTPEPALAIQPPDPHDSQRGWRHALAIAWQAAFRGQETVELVGPSRGALRAHGHLVAPLARGPYQLILRVHPEERGLWETDLLTSLFARLRYLPHNRVITRVSQSHPEAILALKASGFETRRVLDQMALSYA